MREQLGNLCKQKAQKRRDKSPARVRAEGEGGVAWRRRPGCGVWPAPGPSLPRAGVGAAAHAYHCIERPAECNLRRRAARPASRCSTEKWLPRTPVKAAPGSVGAAKHQARSTTSTPSTLTHCGKPQSIPTGSRTGSRPPAGPTATASPVNGPALCPSGTGRSGDRRAPKNLSAPRACHSSNAQAQTCLCSKYRRSSLRSKYCLVRANAGAVHPSREAVSLGTGCRQFLDSRWKDQLQSLRP